VSYAYLHMYKLTGYLSHITSLFVELLFQLFHFYCSHFKYLTNITDEQGYVIRRTNLVIKNFINNYFQ